MKNREPVKIIDEWMYTDEELANILCLAGAQGVKDRRQRGGSMPKHFKIGRRNFTTGSEIKRFQEECKQAGVVD